MRTQRVGEGAVSAMHATLSLPRIDCLSASECCYMLTHVPPHIILLTHVPPHIILLTHVPPHIILLITRFTLARLQRWKSLNESVCWN
jgi:hypothetical protein